MERSGPYRKSECWEHIGEVSGWEVEPSTQQAGSEPGGMNLRERRKKDGRKERKEGAGRGGGQGRKE